jgi:translation initiation factor IF-2
MADSESVDIHYYDIIYKLIEDVQKAMQGLLEPTYVPKLIGEADVRATFDIPRVGRIAGCYVTRGRIERNARVRVVEDGEMVYDGELGSLKRFEEDVREVCQGYECGVGIDDFDDVEVGQRLQFYVMERES